MERCSNCKTLMPDDAAVCLRCGVKQKHVTVEPHAETAGSPNHSTAISRLRSSIRRINWLRVCASVFTSYVFFLASCTTGMLAAGFAGSDDYGPEINERHPGPKVVSVIATVRDAEQQGQRKSVIVFVDYLEEFKKKNPDYSFLLPPGEGRVENVAAEMTTHYVAVANEPGKVTVKSEFHHDVPPFPWGLNVRARYEATDKSVRILNARYGVMESAFLFGLIFATLLAITGGITGGILKRRLRTTAPSAAMSALVTKKGVLARIAEIAIPTVIGVLVLILLILMIW